MNVRDDQFIDTILRPVTFADYIGQQKIKENLAIILEAARRRSETVDHLLFYGQTGLGKTTLAHLVANEMKGRFKITSGTTLERSGDIAAILSGLEEGDILFVDEAHRINRTVEEFLYPALESRKMHITVGRGLGGETMTMDLPAFTMIAATTRPNLLSAPLRSRFGAMFHLDFYTLDDVEAIIRRSASILKTAIEDKAIKALAKAARFTPRIANRLLKRSRDVAEVKNRKAVNEATVLEALDLLEIDDAGLEASDRRLLNAIIEKFRNRPVGIQALCAALGEDRRAVEEMHEPYLLKIGFLERTPQGRVATEAAIEHLKRKK